MAREEEDDGLTNDERAEQTWSDFRQIEKAIAQAVRKNPSLLIPLPEPTDGQEIADSQLGLTKKEARDIAGHFALDANEISFRFSAGTGATCIDIPA